MTVSGWSCSFQLSPKYFILLKSGLNKPFAKVVGERVNRGAGYGLEILHIKDQALRR